jgi:hypothetical protein
MAFNDNVKAVEVPKLSEKDQILADNKDKSLWQWVEVPDVDGFGDVHNGVTINFQKYGPGRHFVNPELAGEIKRLLLENVRAEIRIHSPKQDPKMMAQMRKSQLGAPNNSTDGREFFGN